MGIIRKSKETLGDVSDASRSVIASTQWATLALIAVALLAGCALVIGVHALGRVGG